jgi:hypothetical protein
MKSKFFKSVVVLLLASLVFMPVVQAADVSNLSVTVTQQTGIDFVQFEVTLIHTGAATDNVFSQAIDMAYLDLDGATIQAVALVGGSGRDVNIDIQGSNSLADSTFETYETRGEFDDFSPDDGGLEQSVLLDRDFIKLGTKANLTSVYSAADLKFFSADSSASDPLMIYTEKDRALRCRYIRVVSAGQSGNIATASTKVILTFRKKDNAPRTYDFRLADKNTTS